MDTPEQLYCTAFEGYRRIASGDLAQVVLKTKAVIDRGEKGPVLIFDDVTSEPIEVDFRGTPDDVLKKLPRSQVPESATPMDPGPRGPGRPRLGVVAREVTLLPRHWDWLNDQPGGASVALQARRRGQASQRGQGSHQAIARIGLQIHVCHGRELA